MLPVKEIGLPEYYEKLDRSMKGIKNPNLLYPVEAKTFIHILANREDIRDHYIPVEPSLPMENMGTGQLLDEIEDRIADYVDELEGIENAEKRLEAILRIVDKVVTVRSGNGNKQLLRDQKSGNRASSKGNGKKGRAIVVNPIQYQGLRYLIKRKLEGMGVLERTSPVLVWALYLRSTGFSVGSGRPLNLKPMRSWTSSSSGSPRRLGIPSPSENLSLMRLCPMAPESISLMAPMYPSGVVTLPSVSSPLSP
jgi:hypothetical protein